MRWWRVAFGCASVMAGGSVGASVAAGRQVNGPFTLTSLPSMGGVVWVCGTGVGTGAVYGLGFRGSPMGATQTVTLRVDGRLVARRVVHPGQRLPARLRAGRRHELTVRQATEPGILRARVTVDFSNPKNGFCASYDPPGFTLTVTPRT